MIGDLSGFLEVPAIERRLAAACLALGVIDVMAQSLQYVDHRDSDAGRKLINVTGYKKRDFQCDIRLSKIVPSI